MHEEEGITMAIKTVSEAKQASLTQRLIDYLIGDVDTTPKVHLFSKHSILECMAYTRQLLQRICFIPYLGCKISF